MAWAESSPCLSQKTEGIFNGVVMMAKPTWLIKECGHTEGQVLLQIKLWIKGNGRSPFSDESYFSTNPKGASILLKALDDAGWSNFSENTVRAGGVVATVRHYKHDKFGFLAFGVTQTRTELFLSFVRYR
ncbi:hypothetical protein Mrose_02207 [Calidithermus roseus]|uniref:Uncharacterized protein n=2 Tax=Calidithermus roseus TaxID=1644118 RepID=A0A399EPA3_9DEIN|nr:hypothetical protein Mrose_02207 [Calidithermus roseus]